MNADFTSEEKFLIKKDKVLSNVIKTNGPIKFSNNRKDPFDTFVDIIISQFISTLAAKSIKEKMLENFNEKKFKVCLLYTSPSPRDVEESRMPSSA